MKMANDNLQQVLEGYERERIELDVKFLNQALIAATLNNNHECIGRLIKMGATNIDECTQLAKEKEVDHPVLIMLLLMKAALTGDETFLKLLVNPADVVQELPHSDPLEHVLLRNLRKYICTNVKHCSRSSTNDVLEVAQRCGQYSVHCRLMILACNRTTGWRKLNLTYVDARVLEVCNWITDLDLSANKLSSLPSNVGTLCMVSFKFSVY